MVTPKMVTFLRIVAAILCLKGCILVAIGLLISNKDVILAGMFLFLAGRTFEVQYYVAKHERDYHGG